jgi:hypothetical protein
MFHDLQKLYEIFTLYKEGKPYSFKQSKMQMDYWAEEKAQKMENDSIGQRFGDVDKEISLVNGPKFYKKHLLHSIN